MDPEYDPAEQEAQEVDPARRGSRRGTGLAFMRVDAVSWHVEERDKKCGGEKSFCQ